MKKTGTALFILAAVVIFLVSTAPLTASDERVIQIALLLDTSNSMDGLIDQAKSQLWKIVNELARAKKGNSTPRLEVALYEYGKDSLPAAEGYIRMITPLTTDLDALSEQLFRLETYGGSEYCGKVILAATEGLDWSSDRRDLKLIFIAGNEPFTQGDVDYRMAVKKAVARGITVNTIFCGTYHEGENTMWKDGALLADGRYMNIDHNERIVAINAPQDKEIMRLGAELNKTYIPYGKRGIVKKECQEEQDKNAATVNSEVLVQRSVAKASKQYVNSGWDLVDAVKDRKVDPATIRDDELPAKMKAMNTQERRDYVNRMMKRRSELQNKINKLNNDRRRYVEAEMKKRSSKSTLDMAILKSVRDQAVDQHYTFE
jgi:hypothetical protein